MWSVWTTGEPEMVFVPIQLKGCESLIFHLLHSLPCVSAMGTLPKGFMSESTKIGQGMNI